MALISTEQLQKIIETYLDETDINMDSAAYAALDKVSAVTGLVNKIAATFTIEGDYTEEGLADLDGPEITSGNALEEYFRDFVEPSAFDETGANTLAPSYPHEAPVSYSVEQEKQTFKTTERMSGYSQSFNNTGEMATYVAGIVRRLYDSETLWKNQLKKELLGVVASAHTLNPTKTYDAATASTLKIGEKVKDAGGLVYVVRKSISNNTEIATAVDNGQLVKLDLATSMAIPTDATTGEAFIKSVKDYVAKFMKPRSGYSINGNIAGKGTYKLYIKEGIIPSIEVDTMAGAFNQEKLTFGVPVVEVTDFGENQNVFAMLVDTRGIRVSNVERIATSQLNGEGAFVNYYLHERPLAHWSPNVKVHVWNKAQ